MEITAIPVAKHPVSADTRIITVVIDVYKDGEKHHTHSLNVNVASYENDIKTYLLTVKEAEEAKESIQLGVPISL